MQDKRGTPVGGVSAPRLNRKGLKDFLRSHKGTERREDLILRGVGLKHRVQGKSLNPQDRRVFAKRTTEAQRHKGEGEIL